MNLKVLLNSFSFGMAVSFDHGKIFITLYGDRNDEKLISKRRSLEKMGMRVTIEEKDPNNTAQAFEHPFILKYRGAMLPPLDLVDLDGRKINEQTLAGRMVHICFWSINCRMCIEEFPELDRLKKKYEDDGAVFVAIAPESEDKVRDVLQENPLSYQVVAGARPLINQLGVDSYPESFFIDREGTIVDVTDGSHYKPLMEDDGELVMVTDNFPVYDKIMEQMSRHRVLTD